MIFPTNVYMYRLAILLLPFIATNSSLAITVLDGFGGPRGFGDVVMPRNDDQSSNELTLPFDITFFGNTFNTFFINNNGNITFNSSQFQFTPTQFPVANQPMIAPYWADVDTSADPGDDSNQVYLAAPNNETVVVTWDSVGYYFSRLDKRNTFQLVLRDRTMDTGNVGDFDVEFRYEQLQWTTGDESEGVDGLGGIPAQAGFDAGDQVNFDILPGSFTGAVLDLQNTSNVSTSTPGLWSFAVRSGSTPGSTPDNPLLPVVVDDGFDFEFGISDPNERIFIDPDIAIGYEYIVNTGPNFQSVLLPDAGDNLFDVFLFDELGESFLLDEDLAAGEILNFGVGGIDRFLVLGIEESVGLNPLDPTAFVTGLTFTAAGTINMSQIPVVVPEPASAATLLALSFYLLRLRSRPNT